MREMERKSKRKRQLLVDSVGEEHLIEFDCGRAVSVICPHLGRRTIETTE